MNTMVRGSGISLCKFFANKWYGIQDGMHFLCSFVHIPTTTNTTTPCIPQFSYNAGGIAMQAIAWK
jgi:hypothetical protein